MPSPRSSVPRGTRIRGERPAEPSALRSRGADARSGGRPAEPIADPTRPRLVVDHGLEKRRVLELLRTGGPFLGDLREEYLDPDPYLLRAARHHGEATERPCPVCERGPLRHVTYVFGDDLGEYSGRVKSAREAAEMAHEYGEFRVYVVEVCQDCGWNHLHLSYVLGDGIPRR